MYIVGHYVTTHLSERLAGDAFDGAQAAALYLPDFVRCHEWGYAHCFELTDDDVTTALIKSHLLGDWWVHFGEGRAPQRRGWAYRRMAVFARHYDTFFAAAMRLRLLLGEAERDSVRGFSHTMMEYAIDTHLAASLHTTTFEALQRSVAAIGTARGPWSCTGVRALLSTLGVSGDFGTIEADMASFRERALRARSPAEFAYRAGVRKFGLRDSAASMTLMADTIAAGLAHIPVSELDMVVARASTFIARHVRAH